MLRVIQMIAVGHRLLAFFYNYSILPCVFRTIFFKKIKNKRFQFNYFPFDRLYVIAIILVSRKNASRNIFLFFPVSVYFPREQRAYSIHFQSRRPIYRTVFLIPIIVTPLTSFAIPSRYIFPSNVTQRSGLFSAENANNLHAPVRKINS